MRRFCPRDPSMAALITAALLVAALSIWVALTFVPAAAAERGHETADAAPVTDPSPSVLVRRGEHPGFSRLVFDWPRAVPYRIERQGDTAVLIFEAEARLDLARVLADPPRGLASIDAAAAAGSVRVTVTAAPGSSFKDFRAGTKIAVDILLPGGGAEPVAAAPSLPSEPRDAPESKPADSSPTPEVALVPESMATPEPAPAPAPASASASASASAPAGATPEPVAADPLTAPEAAGTTEVLVTLEGEGATLRIEWAEPVAAAAFMRAGAAWLVFDRHTEFNLRNLAAADRRVFGTARQIEHPGASILRITGAELGVARLTQDGRAWVADFRPGDPESDADIAQTVETDGLGLTSLVFDPFGPGTPVRVSDPEVGDDLWIVPVRASGEGLMQARDWPQFEALRTRQGLAIATRDDRLTVAVEGDRVRISAPDGLIMSAATTEIASAMADSDEQFRPRLFDLAAWRHTERGSYAEIRQQMQDAVLGATPERLAIVRLELARFYLAHGLVQEASGLVALIEETNGESLDPELLLLKGVSRLLSADEDGAAEILAHPGLDGEVEADLWRGALAATLGAWDVANANFRDTAALIADYPRNLRRRLDLLAAEAQIHGGDPVGAIVNLDRLRADSPNAEERDEIAFLDGLRTDREGRPSEAKEIWERLLASPSRPVRAWATLSLTELEFRTGGIEAKDSIERLESVRYLWRGDRFEFELLRRLGQSYVDVGRVRDGLELWRQAVGHIRRHPDAPALTKTMTDAFAAVFAGEHEQAVGSVEAVAIYDEFGELLPSGRRGDEVVAGVADRLIAVDLLDRADALLGDQIEHRLKGVERARAGARLAEIRLIERKPREALAALSSSAATDTPSELAQARRELEVRALFDMGRQGEAFALLQGATDTGAVLLRADLLWRLEDWPKAAAAIDGLIAVVGDGAQAPSAADDSHRQDLILNQAVALTLAGDRAGLESLARRHGEAMAGGALAEPFYVLTTDLDDSAKVRGITDRLATVDRLTGFMDDYRKRLQTANLADEGERTN